MKTIKILDVIVFLYILLFMYAAASKLIDYDLFEAQIGKSPLISAYSSWLAIAVPVIEIIISGMLLSRLQLWGLYAAYSLMLLFTLYIAFMLIFSPYVPCSCGGILSRLGWTQHLIFNAFFTLLAVVGVSLNLKQKNKENSFELQTSSL